MTGQIVQAGSINTTAIIVPDLYVVIVPPQVLALNGVPSNRIGVVGTASWGPVNVATIVGTGAAYPNAFGPLQARKFDMGTQVATAIQQGAQDFRCVRVTDGSDTTALVTFAIGGNAAMGVFAMYTGSLGSKIAVALYSGSAVGTYKFVVYPPYGSPEVFDNIPGPPTANAAGYTAFWTALVAAVNNGIGLRPRSQWVLLNSPGSAAPAASTSVTYLQGGTDGASSVTAQTLLGVDANKTGLFALRGTGCSLVVLADADDATTWSTADAFGLGEGAEMIQTGPSGDTIANAIATKASAGIDSYATKVMFGDWIAWADPVNKITRYVSPQGFVAGRYANLSPEQSGLNKPMYSIVGSQKSGVVGSGQAATYSSAELTALGQAGIDVITNPLPRGPAWGLRFGHNSSSNAGIQTDAYTRLTNYIAATLAAGMGGFVGQLINQRTFLNVAATLRGFFANMLQQGQLGSLDGSLPYGVVCNVSNNPFSRTSLGYLQADVQVQFQAVVEKFLVNLEGGQTVQVAKTSTQLAA